MTISSAEGLEGPSIGRVATEAGVSKGNIQVLFGDKWTLQLATLETAIELYRKNVIVPAMERPSPRLLAPVGGWVVFVEQRNLPGGCCINAVSREYRARPGRIRDRINEQRATTHARFHNLIQEAVEAGEFRPDVDANQLVFELVACQAVANVAALMEDGEEFDRARHSSRDRIRLYSQHDHSTTRHEPCDLRMDSPYMRDRRRSRSGNVSRDHRTNL